MSAVVASPWRSVPEETSRRAPRAASEGWLAVALLALLLLVVAWSVDAAAYRGGRLDWLAWVMLAGVAWGLVAARAGLPRRLAHPLGAALGGALVLGLVAGVVSRAPELADRLGALVARTEIWFADVTGPAGQSQENVLWQLTCGVVAWATAQHASYALFAHGRPLAAILVPGILLVTNMLVAIDVPFVHLVVFTVAALLLLVRMNAVDQQELWSRRRIGEAGSVAALSMRTGVAYVTVTVAAAVVLAQVGTSAPLAGAWTGVGERLQEVALTLNDWFNLAPATRYQGDPFETSQVITGEWDAAGIDTLEVASSDGRPYYLRGAVYDLFADGDRWTQSGPLAESIGAGASLLDALGGDGDLSLDDRTEVTVRIVLLRDLRVVLAPATPGTVSIPVRLERLGELGPFVALRPVGGTLRKGSAYEVVALVPRPGKDGLTANELRRAGTDYPAVIERLYATAPAPGTFDPSPFGHESVPALAARLVAEQDLANPFDVADYFQRYLSDPALGGFGYSANVRGRCRAGESVPDCFLRIREGYCEYYATTMILMLRSEGIPARLAVGYLWPNEGSVVTSSAAHAWAEVYFPGYGWVPFDPTGGNGAAPVEYVEGPVPSASPFPSLPPDDRSRDPLPRPPSGGTPPPASQPGLAPWLPPALLGVAAIALLAIRRRTRRVAPPPDPLAVYRRLTRLAGRYGYPPRPTQTVYEYADALAGVVPEAAPDLETVSRAKVEVTYGRRALSRERLEPVGRAYRRLRFALLRLLVRRGRQGG